MQLFIKYFLTMNTNNVWIGNVLFLLGSLIFTCDASLEAFETGSLRSFIRLGACLLFAFGCLLMMPEMPQKEVKD